MRNMPLQTLNLPEQDFSPKKQSSDSVVPFNYPNALKQLSDTYNEHYASDNKNTLFDNQSCASIDKPKLETDKVPIEYEKQQANKSIPNDRSKINEILKRCKKISKKEGVHSVIKMEAGGFEYTGEGDQAFCKKCNLKVSNWTLDMEPFSIHRERSPNCEIVKYIMSSLNNPLCISSHTTPTGIIGLPTTNSSEQEQPSKRQKIEITNKNVGLPVFSEVEILKQVRRRTFSHWPHRNSPSPAQMIEAGFFHCNVGDRTICIYCSLVCQQWTPHVDDPCEVHKELSPTCPYVVNVLLRREAVSVSIINQSSETNETSAPGTSAAYHSHEIVRVSTASNPYYSEIPKRYQSFSAWPTDPLPSVDDLVRAGFFYTGTATIVTCFFCNGSLQNWGQNDNPTIEHARWFPHCGFAKQLCGHSLYRKIQESKRVAQERNKTVETSSNTTNNTRKLLIPDESTLSRLVAARLDQSVSQKLIANNFKLTVIKRCFEDQLRLKLDDFASECDLLMACIVLQKQIDAINGKKENIIVPSIKMRQMQEALQAEVVAAQSSMSARIASSTSDVEMTSVSQSPTTSLNSNAQANLTSDQTKLNKKVSATTTAQSTQIVNSVSTDPCALCMTEEKSLAFVPCGHLSTCVPCGHSLRSCPICRQKIDAYVRIYI